MRQNVGGLDRILRLLVAVVLALFYSFGTSTGGWSVIWLVVALILAVTAITGVCPLYKLLGIDTTVKVHHEKDAQGARHSKQSG